MMRAKRKSRKHWQIILALVIVAIALWRYHTDKARAGTALDLTTQVDERSVTNPFGQ